MPDLYYFRVLWHRISSPHNMPDFPAPCALSLDDFCCIRIISVIDHRYILGTMIPAFSPAILDNRVSPRYCIWSRLIDVITQATGSSTAVVASSLPPSPVSKDHIIHTCICKYHHSHQKQASQNTSDDNCPLRPVHLQAAFTFSKACRKVSSSIFFSLI